MSRTALDAGQLSAWAEVREYAADALRIEGAYTIAVGAQVHVVATLAELAALTRRERARYGVEWPEDPGARAARRWS